MTVKCANEDKVEAWTVIKLIMVNHSGSRHSFTGDEYLTYIKQEVYIVLSTALRIGIGRKSCEKGSPVYLEDS